MKKYLYTLLVLIACFLLTSFSIIVLSPFKDEETLRNLPDETSQRAYAVIDAVEDFTPNYPTRDNPVINRLAYALASNMTADYDAVLQSLNSGEESIVIDAVFLNPAMISLTNDIDFDFTEYSTYFERIQENALLQVSELTHHQSLYTQTYKIKVTFKDTYGSLKQTAILNEEDLLRIQDACYTSAEAIYEEYINKSEMSTAFFCQSIKELSLDYIAEKYNAAHPDNPIVEEWQKALFKDYAQHYIDSLIIDNIIKSGSTSESSKGTINYRVEQGSTTIDYVCQELLNTYYFEKQPPVEKPQVIADFGELLQTYTYNDETVLLNKTFEFTYSQNLNEFTIYDDFYREIVDDIYEEYMHFEEIFEPYFTKMESLYFFVERPFDGTTIITDNTGDTKYRQVDFNVTGSTDCYIKLYSYDLVTDSIKDIMFEAYIKSGETVQIFIPEGDYIFKYATGPAWYGDVHKFSDKGQYFAGEKVLSVHEYLMTTTIELGNFDNGSIPTYSQTPDLF